MSKKAMAMLTGMSLAGVLAILGSMPAWAGTIDPGGGMLPTDTILTSLETEMTGPWAYFIVLLGLFIGVGGWMIGAERGGAGMFLKIVIGGGFLLAAAPLIMRVFASAGALIS
ncbi:MAG: TrbC/VirB2 family protein [Leptospirales bacterium]